MDTVKYKVTDMFGCRSIGDVIDAYLVCEDQDSCDALIMHKPNELECGSFEICHKDKDGYWVSTSRHYVNFNKMEEINL